MKVLFLDIDGVLNCKGTTQRSRGFIGIDPHKAFLVGKIQLDTDCKVVLSSSWRKFPDGFEEVERTVVPLFDKTISLRVPDGIGGMEWSHRGREIQEWLDRHPEVTRYAIVDDENDMLPEQQPNFFQTSYFDDALTPEIAARITAHLNR